MGYLGIFKNCFITPPPNLPKGGGGQCPPGPLPLDGPVIIPSRAYPGMRMTFFGTYIEFFLESVVKGGGGPQLYYPGA